MNLFSHLLEPTLLVTGEERQLSLDRQPITLAVLKSFSLSMTGINYSINIHQTSIFKNMILCLGNLSILNWNVWRMDPSRSQTSGQDVLQVIYLNIFLTNNISYTFRAFWRHFDDKC